MRIKVDLELCRDHGQCVIAAPQVFRFDQDRKLVWVASPDHSLRGAAEQAITIEED